MSDPYRQTCRVLRYATCFVMAGLGLLVVSGVAGLPLWPPGSVTRFEGSQRLLLTAILALPSLGYLWALWSAQRALGALAAGQTFQLTVARAMRHIGIGVLLGALLQVFAVTNLLRVAFGGRGSYLYFDLSAIVLGVIGAALILLAHLVDRARALQAELDEIL
ncbi:MAG: DUF2975 domain-containing protein [Lysobacterales bacterium]